MDLKPQDIRTRVPGPIIGILCVDRLSFMKADVKSYIKEEYVQFLKKAGAQQVVPIWIDQPFSYYTQVLDEVNGVLFQGGQVYVNKSDPEQASLTNHCVRSAHIIISIAKKKNEEGCYFPIFGICLGFQLLALFSEAESVTPEGVDGENAQKYAPPHGEDPREICEFLHCHMPVTFSDNFRDSRMFQNLSPEMENIMKSKKIFYHLHRYCVSVKRVEGTRWKALGTNLNHLNATPFVTFLEHKIYPFFGAQIHPEYIPEPADEVEPYRCLCRMYLGEFFVNECRKNTTTLQKLSTCDIHTFPMDLIEKPGPKKQYYLFKD